MTKSREDRAAELRSQTPETLSHILSGYTGVYMGSNISASAAEAAVEKILDFQDADQKAFAAQQSPVERLEDHPDFAQMRADLLTHTDDTLQRIGHACMVCAPSDKALNDAQRNSLATSIAKRRLSDLKASGQKTSPAKLNIDLNSKYAKGLTELSDSLLAAVAHGEGVSGFSSIDGKLSQGQRDTIITKIVTEKTRAGVLPEARSPLTAPKPMVRKNRRPASRPAQRPNR